MREDKEFQEFRDMMKRPDTFEEGFNRGTILMGLFVGLVMAPASVYMSLVAGLSMGGADWAWIQVMSPRSGFPESVRSVVTAPVSAR